MIILIEKVKGCPYNCHSQFLSETGERLGDIHLGIVLYLTKSSLVICHMYVNRTKADLLSFFSVPSS